MPPRRLKHGGCQVPPLPRRLAPPAAPLRLPERSWLHRPLPRAAARCCGMLGPPSRCLAFHSGRPAACAGSAAGAPAAAPQLDRCWPGRRPAPPAPLRRGGRAVQRSVLDAARRAWRLGGRGCSGPGQRCTLSRALWSRCTHTPAGVGHTASPQCSGMARRTCWLVHAAQRLGLRSGARRQAIGGKLLRQGRQQHGQRQFLHGAGRGGAPAGVNPCACRSL